MHMSDLARVGDVHKNCINHSMKQSYIFSGAVGGYLSAILMIICHLTLQATLIDDIMDYALCTFMIPSNLPIFVCFKTYIAKQQYVMNTTLSVYVEIAGMDLL